MPNTLAHLGVQSMATRAVFRGADIKWMWLGAVIPDLPWILQRAVRALAPEVSAHDLRLYAVVQASLVFCVLFAAAAAAAARQPTRAFGVLAIGAFMHLLLDAAQTKWANGVHFFAPFSWEMTNFGLFWPEDWPTLALTLLGGAFAVYAWLREKPSGDDLRRLSFARGALIGALFALYLAGPLAFLSGPAAADNHFVETLRDREARVGQPIEVDRARVAPVALDGGAPERGLRIWTGEHLRMEAGPPEAVTKASIKGVFTGADTVAITHWRAHPAGVRDGVSYLGLGIVALWWVSAFWRRWRGV